MTQPIHTGHKFVLFDTVMINVDEIIAVDVISFDDKEFYGFAIYLTDNNCITIRTPDKGTHMAQHNYLMNILLMTCNPAVSDENRIIPPAFANVKRQTSPVAHTYSQLSFAELPAPAQPQNPSPQV